ncbi:MAG: trypsin-like serine protease [Phycisphaeraceae bacterium]|nr:trypsin-like serine protease [Phycisphaeraceae bacterium]
MCRVIVVLCWLLAALASSHALGQQTLDLPRGAFVPVGLDTGLLSNPADTWTTIDAGEINVDGAAWIRVYFDALALPSGSFLRVTAPLDGEEQILDEPTAALWRGTTAYFNGDRVRLEVSLPPGSAGVRVATSRVAAEGEGAAFPAAYCGICLPDTRFQTGLNAVGRLMPVGCSGVVSCAESVVLSAGHCISGDLVVQFNVPDSEGSCKPVHPPVEHQFPVTGAIYNNGGVGNDWAVLTTGVNNEGVTIFEKYKAMLPVSDSPATLGQSVDVWGYGAVEPPDCQKTQTQQHSGGEITLVKAAHYKFDNDVTYGNSGSPLVAKGAVVGIVTHCNTVCANNVATRVNRPDFAAAREAASACTVSWCAADFDGDTVLDSRDFVVFLNAYAAGDMEADFTGDTVVNSLDFISFLNAFVSGC